MSEACIVSGCSRSGRNKLGVRLRKPDTNAIWSPDTGAFVCDTHARSGVRLTVIFEATQSGRVEVRTHAAGAVTSKTASITH